MRHWRAYVLAAPGMLLGGTLLVCLVLAVFGRHPFWLVEPLTLSEAAALRDAGEVARQLRDGADARRTYRVRPGLLDHDLPNLTPLSAALAANRPEIVELLVEAGVPPPPQR